MKTSGICLIITCIFTILSGYTWTMYFPLAFAFATCASLCFAGCMFNALQGD